MVSIIRVWKAVGRWLVLSRLTKPRCYTQRLRLATPSSRTPPVSSPLSLLSLAPLPGYKHHPSTDKHSPDCNRVAEIRLDQRSDNLNQLDLPLVFFQMAACPRLRQFQPHVQFQDSNATTGSPLPMYAGSGWSCLVLMAPQNQSTDAKRLK